MAVAGAPINNSHTTIDSTGSFREFTYNGMWLRVEESKIDEAYQSVSGLDSEFLFEI